MFRTIFLVLAAAVPSFAFAATGSVEFYRDPNCGCCGAHAEYLRDHGFQVEVISTERARLSELKREHGITRELAACHTALVDGYVVEGHVPVDSIERMLEQRPAIAGIAVPGMPVGSPGMGDGLREPLRVWTIPAGDEAPRIHSTYQRLPE